MTVLPETRHLDIEQSQGWLTVFLNVPESRNALTGELVKELCEVLKSVHDDRSIRGITLRGRGGVFCAGGDLKTFSALRDMPDDTARREAHTSSLEAGELFEQVHAAPQIVVALIEGAAIAGGLGLACAADFAFATREARLMFSETRIGITPAQIAPYVIAKAGLRKSKRLLLLGDRLNGEEAHALGLVDEVADSVKELEQLEADLKKRVFGCAPGAVYATKRVIDRAGRLMLDDLKDSAAIDFANTLVSAEGREGVASFLEKRKPAWATNSDY